MTTGSLTELRAPKKDISEMPNTRVDMFSMQGFALAQRVATAFASSNAVPAIFRSHVEKKVGSQFQWIENPNALGNCLVAIEVAQAVGMSVTAVMQNADVIEGKLRWSGKFVIAAINASRRFAPLRFQMRNLGKIKAKYKEKLGWNDQKRGFDFAEREVEIENEECIAWSLPYGFQAPAGIYTLEQARAAGLPVIESAPVTMRMVVEEGWYSKAGSKWQTDMKALMFQYRAGSFFGNIHAPDVVMGMGRTSEEERDMGDLVPMPDGSYAVSLDDLRNAQPPQQIQASAAESIDESTGEIHQSANTNQEAPAKTNAANEMTAEEKAAILANEQAEAEADQGQTEQTTTRAARTPRARPQTNIE